MKENIEEYMKILEDWLKELNDLFNKTRINNTKERNALEHILSDYKRVLKENELARKALIEKCNIADERNQLLKENEELKHKYDKALSDLVKAENETIPVQKVKDKIEELKKKSGGNVFHIQQTINAEIRLLQELLEEKDEKQ